MKKSILLFASVLMLVFVGILGTTGCESSSNKKYKKEESELEQAIAIAQKAEVTEKIIFLDFLFGMTQEEVEAHLDELKKINKVYLENDKYTYLMHTTVGLNLYLNFIPKYYEGKLYKMIYPISTDLMSETSQYVFARGVFGKTERFKQMKSFITKDVLGETIYTSIKDNLIITFEDNGGSEMSYTNAPIAKIAEEEKSKRNLEKVKSTYGDF